MTAGKPSAPAAAMPDHGRVARRNSWLAALLVFAVSAALAAMLVRYLEQERVRLLRTTVSAIASDHAGSATENIKRNITVSYMLAMMVRQNGGAMPDLKAVSGDMLPHFRGLSAVSLAPEGVIRQIEPLAGNEAVIGLDLLKDPARAPGALAARDSGAATLVGPLKLVQGGEGLVAYLPVFLNDAEGRRVFWGLVGVTMRLPDALVGSGLPRLKADHDIDFVLWKRSAADGPTQIILASTAAPLDDPVEALAELPYGNWTLSVAPARGWGDPLRFWLGAGIGLCLSLLLAMVAKLLIEARAHERGLEMQVARRTAEAVESRRQMQATLDALPDIMFELGPDSRIYDVHSSRASQLVLPVEKLVGTLYTAAAGDDGVRLITAALSEALERGHSSRIEFELLLPTGRRWQEASISRKEVAAGQEQRFVLLARDITKRKAAEELVRKLLLAVEQSPESIAITNVNAEIEYVNDAFVRESGYSREDVIGQNPRVLHSGNTPPETYVAMWQALSQGKTWKGEFHNKRKDGGEYVEFAIIAPLRQPDGSISHYVAIKEDITERKRIGRELDAHRNHLEALVQSRTTELVVAREAAEAASRAKTRFLGTMSHELRTPMNAVLGFSRLLHDQHLPAQQDVLARKIVEASERLLALLNGIIDYAALEGRDDGNVELAAFDVPAMLADATAKGFQAAKAKGLQTGIDIDPDLPARLHGDARIIQRVLEQLIGNAVKFTERGAIRVSVDKLAGETDGRLRLRFRVSDSGIGIPPEIEARLFQPFMQADDGIGRKFEGIGLGLALCRELARLMGGDIGVASEPGKGSSFWLQLALRADDSEAPSPVSASLDVPASPSQARASALAGGRLPEDVLATLQMLDKLLHACDTRAADVLAQEAPRLRPWLGERFETVSAMIDAFDYDQAIQLLADLKTAAPGDLP